MIASDINNSGSTGRQLHDLFDHLKMTGRKVSFSELPDINNIPIQNE
jgi:hypothetical protein